ncbi:PAS domain S-box protein [Halorhabdus sp. BNX81]|uniref:PAS domain-containing sensor histidine kinase n=1 Tax=Halorhabdus sp. BNX81 TaxID=2980181 RepID=UPI0023DD5DBC|nr:PAS domain S-box protein [Halorhabdus sp. BNX81]
METGDAIARKAFEKAATIMVVLDADGVIQRINDRGCQVLGYDRSALLGADWFETVVPAGSDVDLDALLGAVQGNESVDIHENTVRTDDGEIRCIKWHVTGLRDDAGNVTELLVSGSDITEREETERRLRRYEQTVESSTNQLAVVDREYTYELANRNYRRFHGLGEEIPAELTIADVYGTETFEAIKPAVDRALAGESLAYETTRPGPDGDDRTFDVRYFPLVANDDTVEGAVAALREVTEQRARERERRETRDTFEGLFHGINDAVFVHDFDGQFLAVNETARERLGYDEGELLGMTPQDIDASEHADSIDERIETILEEGELTFEAVHITKAGEQIPVEITSSLVTYFGEEAILSVARDITDRKERERQLEREVDRLAEFAGVISHDLRNPLNVAQSRITLAAEECDEDHEHIAPVVNALDRMETIIEDTLMLARQGETVGETEPVAIADVVGQCWDAVETADGTLELATEFTVRADRDRLQHVFENLFRNAVEHASRSPHSSSTPRDAIEHGGDDVTIRVGRIGDDGFYVEDDGPGIPAADYETVFEPGFSIQDEGTGFGLTIVRQIAEAHGWTVDVTDGAAGGARFEFTGVDIVE